MAFILQLDPDPIVSGMCAQVDEIAGVLVPRIREEGLGLWSLSLYIEMWEYYRKAVANRSVYQYDDASSTLMCGEAFNISTLRKVDLGIGSLPAYGYVLKGSEEYLDHVYGEWRVKIDKTAHAPDQGKSASWIGANLLAVCQRVFDSESEKR